MLIVILGIVISYLIGSIPTAYILGRLLKGIDIRNFGSGNVGATNALRVLGRTAGIAVLVLDILKGFLSVAFLGDIVAARSTAGISDEMLRIILGLSCICGHNWTVFLRFKGGKGMAATFGVLAALSLKLSGIKIIFAFVLLTWILIFIIVRIVSLASVVSGVALPVYMILFKQSPILITTSIILSVFIILRHKSNLKRIIQGSEPRLTLMSKRHKL